MMEMKEHMSFKDTNTVGKYLRKKIKIDSEMIGRQVKVYATTTITNTNTGKIKFMLRSGKIIESVDIGKKYKENVTIPKKQ